MKIYKSILETIGKTPLVEISPRLNTGAARVLAKVEFFNPGGSVKDRAALNMILGAERRGELKPGMTIIEPTSGNTGVGLALVAAIRGYHVVLVMPDTMSIERRRLAAAYGAEVVLTPGAEGMAASIARAEELKRARGGIILQQFVNPDNAPAHELTTGPEIWEDAEGRIDAFVATVGTGGTFTGIARYLKAKNPAIRTIAVEPAASPMLSKGYAAPHRLQGIGANFIPEVLDRSLIDEVMVAGDVDSGRVARAAAAQEGMLVGISSGTALWAALEVARRPEFAGKTIVTLLPDTGERYLSTWLFAE